MKIKSKLRLILIPSTIIVILGLSTFPYSTFINNVTKIKVYNEIGGVYWPSVLLGFLIISLIIYSIYRIITKTIFVTFNLSEEIISFQFPFRQFKRNYRFNELDGFKFSSFYSRMCDYKCIIFKTKDKRTYKISDFEISNFRQIEKLAIENLNLLGSDFQILSGSQKQEALIKNKNFDLTQAKEIRITCYLLLILSLSIVISFYFFRSTTEALWATFTAVFLVIFCVNRITQTNKTIKNFS